MKIESTAQHKHMGQASELLQGYYRVMFDLVLLSVSSVPSAVAGALLGIDLRCGKRFLTKHPWWTPRVLLVRELNSIKPKWSKCWHIINTALSKRAHGLILVGKIWYLRYHDMGVCSQPLYLSTIIILMLPCSLNCFDFLTRREFSLMCHL